MEKTLGALPVVAEYCRRLDLAGIVERACQIRELADLTHLQVIETLVANRLTSPAPLVRVAGWASEHAVEEVFGIDPALLNDDRIGRALDAIAPELDRIIGSVGAQAISDLPASVTAAEILLRYKGQEVVERRYGTFKGPLAVAPMFLKNNRRITALITVICLALLIFCLIECQVRHAIAPQTTLDGLYTGRPAKPTGRLIFETLARLRLILAANGRPPGIPQPPPLQARLLDLLDVDPPDHDDQITNSPDNHPELINPYMRNTRLAGRPPPGA